MTEIDDVNFPLGKSVHVEVCESEPVREYRGFGTDIVTVPLCDFCADELAQHMRQGGSPHSYRLKRRYDTVRGRALMREEQRRSLPKNQQRVGDAEIVALRSEADAVTGELRDLLSEGIAEQLDALCLAWSEANEHDTQEDEVPQHLLDYEAETARLFHGLMALEDDPDAFVGDLGGLEACIGDREEYESECTDLREELDRLAELIQCIRVAPVLRRQVARQEELSRAIEALIVETLNQGGDPTTLFDQLDWTEVLTEHEAKRDLFRVEYILRLYESEKEKDPFDIF